VLKKPSKQTLSSLAFCIALVVFAGMSLGFIPKTAGVCDYDSQGNPENCTPESIFLAVFPNTMHFLDVHNGLITALATAAIGYFTFTLWRFTEATKTLAELALPRPHIFISLEKSNILRWGGCEDKMVEVSVSATNYGRAPAVIEYWLSGVFVQGDIPEQNKGLTILELHHDNIVKEDGMKSLEFPRKYTTVGRTYVSIDSVTSTKLSKDEFKVYLYGIVQYRDIFNRSYKASYCVSYVWGIGAIQAEGDSEYNYQT
jgi:hypothetical protein